VVRFRSRGKVPPPRGWGRRPSAGVPALGLPGPGASFFMASGFGVWLGKPFSPPASQGAFT
jgi:hypothetical protein